MTIHVYICMNNGITGVVSKASMNKLEQIHARENELHLELIAAGKSPYSVDTYAIAQSEAGHIPVATFTDPTLFGSLRDHVTGTNIDYFNLMQAAGAVAIHGSFGVPFSNGIHMSRPDDKVTLSELFEIFGLNTHVERPLRGLATV